jgi:hypothetical protein
MTNGESPISETADSPTVFALICGLICIALLAFLLLWYAAPTMLKHVADVTGALSPFP